MTTTNPLDRIRSLAPADMTDDELGVACDEIRYPTQYEHNGITILKSPDESVYTRLYPTGTIAFGRAGNPATDDNARRDLVNWWLSSDPKGERNLAMLDAVARFEEQIAETDEQRFLAKLNPAVGVTNLSTRQLAEAFVTAAREVG